MIGRRELLLGMLSGFALMGCNRKGGASIMGNERAGKGAGAIDQLGWGKFLLEWSKEVLNLLKTPEWIPTSLQMNAMRTGYLGFQGATLDAISKAESRINAKLPPSYKEFLKASNGWCQIAMDAQDGRIFTVEEVGWFRNTNPNSLDNWLSASPKGLSISDREYFTYGPDQDPTTLRDEYLREALAVSEEVDAAIYLLNPEVKTKEGEWEAWFFGYKLPGANRYRSFKEMMEAERVRTVQNLKSAIEYKKSQR